MKTMLLVSSPLRLLAPYCLTVLLFLLTVQLTAQDVTETATLREKTDFKAGYFGNLSANIGLNLGAEYRWKERVKVKERKKGQKTIKRQLLLHGSLGYATNLITKTQHGVFAYSGLILRRVNAKRYQFFLELNPLGLYRSVLPTTYEVVGDNVTSVSLPGRSYYAPSVAIGTGRFRRGTKKSGWYLNLQYTVLTNYNAGALPIFSLHFGRKFNFKRK
ncbi:MAG: hypothetical protein AAFZ52_06655 [Bacteroidota bacterium]